MVVTKGHTYLKKHSAFRCNFVKYVWHFVTTRHQSVNGILKFCIVCLIAYYLSDYNCFVYSFMLYFRRVLLKKTRSVWIKPESMPMTANSFWIVRSKVGGITHVICSILIDKVGEKLIKFSINKEEVLKASSESE